jgi:hypothetical protein
MSIRKPNKLEMWLLENGSYDAKRIHHDIEKNDNVNTSLCEYVSLLFKSAITNLLAYTFGGLLLTLLVFIVFSYLMLITLPLYVGSFDVPLFILEIGLLFAVVFTMIMTIVGVAMWLDGTIKLFPKWMGVSLSENKKQSLVVEYVKAVKNKVCPMLTLGNSSNEK